MIRDLKAMYVAILDNRVIFCETNLTKFWEILSQTVPDCPTYKKCYDSFKKDRVFTFAGKDDKVYVLQRIV